MTFSEREQTERDQIEQLVPTELINPDTTEIDQVSTQAVLQMMNTQDQQVPLAIQPVIPEIAKVVEQTTERLRAGGRLFYFGAGTSGRLGVLDASECPPTYGTDPELVQAFIAGGDYALRHAVEGAEDSVEAGIADLTQCGAHAGDVVIGISASGGAPYVVGAVEAAKKLGCYTAGITCVADSPLARAGEQPIVVNVGPEVIAGSTRMKAGTAQKLVLNMITTATMVQLGKTYRNLMVDVQPTNAKLVKRAHRLVSTLADVDIEMARQTLEQCDYRVKTAIVMLKQNVTVEQADAKLAQVAGKLRAALQAV